MKGDEKEAAVSDYQNQCAQLEKMAQESGLKNDDLFLTTFDRYKTQIEILEQLKAIIEADGIVVTKEYVKGSKNVYTNPAVNSYNRTVDSANKTCATLMKILKEFRVKHESSAEDDPLVRALMG